MKECPKCRQQNSSKYRFCLQCGEELPSFFKEAHFVTLSVCWAIAFAILIYFSTPEKQVITTAQPTPTPIPQVTATPTPNSLPPEINPEEAYHTEVELPDGSTGIFDIYMLNKEFVWLTGSHSILETEINLSRPEIWKTAFSTQLQEKIKKAKEIIVVGTADVRGQPTGQNSLAGSRSRTLLKVVSSIRGSGRQQTAFTFNLGQWKGDTDVALEDQRRVIFIEIDKRSAGLDLRVGVREALKKFQGAQPIFRDMLTSYTKSENFDIR
jgi:hypothetical protein